MSENKQKTPDELIDDLPETIKEWARVHKDTSPGNKSDAETGIFKCYMIDGVELPKFIMWFGSPRAALCVTSLMHKLIEDEKIFSFLTDVVATREFVVDTEVRIDKVEDCFNAEFNHNYQRIYMSVPKAWFYTDEFPYGEDILWKTQGEFGCGQLDAQFYCLYDHFDSVLEENNEVKKIRVEIQHIAKNASWFARYKEGVAVLCEKLSHLHLDNQNRPHCTHETAIGFPDSYGVYLWHDVHVNEWIIKHPERITVDLIKKEKNAEIRRVLLERFGAQRFMDEAGFIVIDDDPKFGKLIRSNFETNLEPLCFIQVIDSTPAPDGTRKHYLLKTSPDMKTAKEAQWMAAEQPGALEDFDITLST